MGRTNYVLDAKASQFTVQAFAEGLAGIADHRPRFSIGDFSGNLVFDPVQLQNGSLHLTARTGSLKIMDEVTQQDRKSIERVMFGEVLHPDKYPEVVFDSLRVVCSPAGENRYSSAITGVVALHGNTNTESIQAQLVLSDGSLRAYGELKLRQSDYGIALASVAGGILRIRDELKFTFFLVART